MIGYSDDHLPVVGQGDGQLYQCRQCCGRWTRGTLAALERTRGANAIVVRVDEPPCPHFEDRVHSLYLRDGLDAVAFASFAQEGYLVDVTWGVKGMALDRPR